MNFRTSFLVISILVFIFSLPTKGNSGNFHFSKICETKWFADQTKEAQNQSGRFFFVADSSFKHKSQEYALAVIFPTDSSVDGVNLLFLERKKENENYKILSETPIPTLLLILNERLAQEGKTSCILPHLPPYFDATIIDLDGNGTPEVVIEANHVGTCSRCLSEVRVFEKKGEFFEKVIEEAYNDLEMGTGKGLIVHSYEVGDSGPIATKKQFYMQK